MTSTQEKVDGIVVVPEASHDVLNLCQLEDYRDHRRKLITWMRHLGKDPENAEGYAHDTTRQRSYKIDAFYRWVWEYEDGCTLAVTTEHADEYSKELAYEETSQTHKAGIQKAIKTLFKYYRYEKGRNLEWDPSIQYSNGGSNTHQIRDFLTMAERRKIKQASLKYGDGIPHPEILGENTVTNRANQLPESDDHREEEYWNGETDAVRELLEAHEVQI
ncbi:hypothetical protein [Halosolutus halophilus]|uniref:hypothetical protein n=1 Tax=Halosolutus halophilus TaxID=1552990 RepID=UPI002234FC9B|nr:hypothetical protein [Halosolutus halophilus]